MNKVSNAYVVDENGNKVFDLSPHTVIKKVLPSFVDFEIWYDEEPGAFELNEVNLIGEVVARLDNDFTCYLADKFPNFIICRELNHLEKYKIVLPDELPFTIINTDDFEDRNAKLYLVYKKED